MRSIIIVIYLLFFSIQSIALSSKYSVNINKDLLILKIEKTKSTLCISTKQKPLVDSTKKNSEILLKQRQKSTTLNLTVDSSKIKIDESHANADTKEIIYSKKHIVVTGESLPKIALKYKVTQQQLIKWNNIKNNIIIPGQELIVSGNSTVKPYERWNAKNTTSSKPDSFKSITSSSSTQIQEVGPICTTSKVTHPSLKIGTFILCVNPENNTQILTQIESNEKLNSEYIIGLPNNIIEKLYIKNGVFRIMIKYNQSANE